MLASMRIDEHIGVLRADGVRLAEAAERAGADAEIPTCPGWRMRDLLGHLGGVHRWAASYLTTGRSEPWSETEQAGFFQTVADEKLVGWFRDGHAALAETLRGADEATTCWSFLPAPSPLAFWARRQAHETAIHRADAESAISAVPRWNPDFAADGIDELLTGFLSRPSRRLVADPPVRLAVAATDADTAWTVHIEPGGRRVVPGRHTADLTVAGPASDLYLLLWNRGGDGALEIRGDRAILDLWRARARVAWK
jgi:uncharacterized protein (TIGR03083 family)